MNNAAKIANIAMWVMVAAIILTFFTSSSWVKILWGIAAVVCLVSVIIVANQKRRNRKDY